MLALIYLAIIPSGPLSAGWGIPIATDMAFAIALIVLLGGRVPVELQEASDRTKASTPGNGD